MLAANDFRLRVASYLSDAVTAQSGLIGSNSLPRIQCILKGSLSFTGLGHGTDRAIMFGLNGYSCESLISVDIDCLAKRLLSQPCLVISPTLKVNFDADSDIIFDKGLALKEHPNGMVFSLLCADGKPLLSQTYFSIGGGFIKTQQAFLNENIKECSTKDTYPFQFDSANSMLVMAKKNALSIAQMKLENERVILSENDIMTQLDNVWHAMLATIKAGLGQEGVLPGGLNVPRRAKHLFEQLNSKPEEATLNDWLCAYAMAVNEENAAGHSVVTAPTNGAAGVLPAVLYYFIKHDGGRLALIHEFLLTAGAIGGIIKHRSSISGAEVGCQGEVGVASAMAASGLCAVKGGSPEQIENAAEIALEHHLGMTCDPVKGLVQVPCIERNGFGAIKAYTAASLALRGSGEHFMSLDNCIAAMKETGLEMSTKFKETALGGLAVNYTDC
jgi:L-serine dehydratase